MFFFVVIERDERPPAPGLGQDHHMYVGEHHDFCDFPQPRERRKNRKIRERERASLILNLHLSLKTRRDERLLWHWLWLASIRLEVVWVV